MIRVLHTGDIHLGDLAGPTKEGDNLRRQDTLRCMDYIAWKAREQGPHLSIIAGDLFNRSRVWADTALEDVNDALDRLIRPLCEHSDQVVLLFGTMNHDNPRAFEVIKKATESLPNLHIFTLPGVEEINTSAGKVSILAVPGFDKARLRLFCPGADKEAENRNATALINDTIMGLATQLDPNLPAVMVAHYTVSGSEADNGSTFLAGQDVVILPSAIDAARVDLACFGHIHKPQKLVSTTPAYYCGSPNQLTFNDEGVEHGFWFHEIDPENRGKVVSTFEPAPERAHFTIRMKEAEVAAFITTGEYAPPVEAHEAIVRVRYSCTAEQDKAFNRAELQKQIMAAGAFWVAEITPEDIEALEAKDQLTEHDGPVECLSRWLEANDITGDRAARLKELADPIIKKADDGRDDGKHAGAFIPRAVEVTNYRSYTSASFDFEPVHMAMVNGQNGVGKSSLFMDAIADCLFEQTRKEDVGGWVRDGTKSGAITFAFGLGGQEYRVIRTRIKSGRGTLALQRFNAEAVAWEDESDTTMKLTQEKIIRLLGMDCNTFCSIALIRQDAYGLFLDADSDRRMEVLSALLGLDIYSRMEDGARAASTEKRREINAIQTKIGMLADQIDQKDQLQARDAELVAQAEELEGEVKELEEAQKAADAANALRQEIVKQAEEKKAKAVEYAESRDAKTAELGRIKMRRDAALAGARGIEEAQKAADDLEATRRRLDELAPARDRDKDLSKSLVTHSADVGESEGKITLLEHSRLQYEGIMARRGEISAALEALKTIGPRVEAAQAKADQLKIAAEASQKAKADLDTFSQDSRLHISNLENRLKIFEAEAEKLGDSGCPIPDGASCKFLASATKAKREIPALEEELKRAKAYGAEEGGRLTRIYEEAKAAEEAIGDPVAILMDIEEERKRLQAVADLAPQLSAAEAKLEEIARNIALERENITRAEGHMKEIQEEQKALAPAMEEYERLYDAIPRLKELADMLGPCQTNKATAEALAPQIESLQKEIADLEEKWVKAEGEALEASARIPEPSNNFVRLDASIKMKRNTLTAIASERGAISSKLETVAEAEQNSAALRRELETTAATLNDYTTLAQAFGIDGIQYMIIRGVVPEIMRQSNDILASMTGGRMAVDIRTEKEQKSTKQIVNSLEVWINTLSGGTRPYQSHSGGEKVKIALAVTLGLADVKARRAGVQLGMLFIDEPPFLDGDGTEAYADALVSMATRNPDMRILAISHDPTMKARFSQNIIVSAGEDGSTVTME